MSLDKRLSSVESRSFHFKTTATHVISDKDLYKTIKLLNIISPAGNTHFLVRIRVKYGTLVQTEFANVCAKSGAFNVTRHVNF